MTSVAVLALALAAFPSESRAALDASCPGPSDDTDTFNDGVNPMRVGQAFTALNSGALVRIEIEVSKTVVAPAPWIVQVVTTDGAGVPTNNVLAALSVPDSSVPAGISRLAVELNPGAAVEAGQRYAFALTRSGPGSFGVRERTGDPCPVQEFESPTQTGAWMPVGDPMEDIVFSSFVEPDCDRDGLGDESQDNDLRACPPGPNAAITKAPRDKVKTKKKKKKVTYQFSSNEQGATFSCVLDGRQEFKACTSPLRVKVKKGKHTFSVTATDSGGNTGAPATDTFKVKRKRKKG